MNSTFTVSPLPAIDQTSIPPDAQGVNPEKTRALHCAGERDHAFDAITIETVVTTRRW